MEPGTQNYLQAMWYTLQKVLARGSPRKPVEVLGDRDGQGKFLEETWILTQHPPRNRACRALSSRLPCSMPRLGLHFLITLATMALATNTARASGTQLPSASLSQLSSSFPESFPTSEVGVNLFFCEIVLVPGKF